MMHPVAVLQPELDPEDADLNRQTVARLVEQAVARSAKLVVLPEACISGLHRDAASQAEPIPGPSTAAISAVAGDALIALPLLEKSGDRIFSTCAIVGREGVRAVARKTHLFRDPAGLDAFCDSEIICPGGELSVLDLGDLRLGVLLGFDAEFPEAFRALTLRGADLIAVVMNGMEPDARYLSAIALRNHTPLLIANRIGFKKIYPLAPETNARALPLLQQKDGSFLIRCKGGSAIIDENGRIVAQPAREDSGGAEPLPEPLVEAPEHARIPSAHFQTEEILSASFSLNELRERRASSPYVAGRREALYRVKLRLV
jgi:predicted amidohydrolase